MLLLVNLRGIFITKFFKKKLIGVLLFLVDKTFVTLPHETEVEIAYNHVTLNFECQDGSSSQIVIQKEVLDCIILLTDSISNPKKWLFSNFSV